MSNYFQIHPILMTRYLSLTIANEILMSLRSAKKLKHEVYLSDPIGIDREGNEISLLDILGTEPDSIVDEVGKKLEIHRVLKLMDKLLGYRERIVLELRYGILDGVSRPQREIAKLLGISRSYVSRIERKAIEQLAEGLEKNPDVLSRLMEQRKKVKLDIE